MTRPVVVVIPLRVVTRSVRTRPGKRFVVGIVPAGRRAYHWQLGKTRGFASARRLVVRAPRKAGRYALVIRQDGLAHRVLVVVSK